MPSMLKNRWIQFGGFALLSLIIFFPTRYSGLVYDFIGWQEQYDHGSWGDIIHCFGYHGLHQVLHLVFFSLYQLLKVNAFGWYIVFAIAHGGVVFLTYQWLVRLQEAFGFKLFRGAAVAGALFVLFHPHSVEVVVWKVCIHYILSSVWLLVMMTSYLNYTKTNHQRDLVVLLGCYLLSLFTLEISYVYIAIMGLLILTYAVHRDSTTTFWHHMKKVILPMAAIFGGHLLLNRTVLGSWVGHYGADVHLSFNFINIITNEFKYLVKHLSLIRYGGFHLKVAVFDGMNHPAIGRALLVGTIGLIAFWAFRLRKFNTKTKIGFVGFWGFFILIFPIANLFFYHLLLAPNDRFGYVAMIPLALFILVLIDSIPTKFKYAVLGLWLISNAVFHQKISHTWRKSTIAFDSLIEDFRWYDRDKVVMMNLPDNFNGVLIFSTIDEPSGFVEALEYNRRKKFEGTMYDGYLYNMMDLADGVNVSQIGPRTLKIEFDQWGNWWYFDGIGARNYETEFYKITNQGHHFEMEIKDAGLDATYIYQDGIKLHEFEFNPEWKPTE